MTIEQAVFVTDSAGNSQSYTLAARTAGLTEADASEITLQLGRCGRSGGQWPADGQATVCRWADGRGLLAKPVRGRAASRRQVHALLVSAETFDRLDGDATALWTLADEAGLITVDDAGPAIVSSCGRTSQRSDAGHRWSAEPAGAALLAGPSRLVPGVSDEMREMLEHLDETVFQAIGGDADGLARVEVLWPLVVAELEPDVAEQCREHYLRYAISIWNDFLADGARDTLRAVAALDVLCLLFEA